MKDEKYLFLLDLDGTTLSDSQTCEIHRITKTAIQKLKDLGHYVCITTARPWRSVKNIYNELNLDTVISNHNGAHIHQPYSDSFISILRYIDLNTLMYILDNKNLKRAAKNIAIQGVNWVQLKHEDTILENIFGFNTIEKFRLGIDLSKMPLKPIGAIIDIKDGIDVVRLGDYLKRRYGDLANFSNWPKGNGLSPVFEISSVGSKKNVPLSYLSRFYGVKNKNVIAIGDGWNDIDMFKVAGISVAMKNSLPNIQKYATHVTDLPNYEGGVGDFINKFLENPAKYKKLSKTKKIFLNENRTNLRKSGYH